MQFHVKLGKAPFSARKAKYVLDLIRGKDVNAALDILQFCHRRPARAIEKLIRSCLANVEYMNESEAKRGSAEVDIDTLVLTEARADEGPLLGYARRWMPRARGMAFPLNLRTSHIKLTFTAPEEEEEVEEVEEETEEAAEGVEPEGETEETTEETAEEKTEETAETEEAEEEETGKKPEKKSAKKPAKKRAKKTDKKSSEGEDD